MLGITMEGGASRTVFSCGVLDVLMEENIVADCFVGVSAGISFGISYLSGQHGRNYTLATEYMPKKKYMHPMHLLNPKNRSIYNLDYVFDEVPNKLLPFDYDALKRYPGKAFAVLTNVDTAEAEYHEIPRDDRKSIYLRASCALPMLFPIFTINGHRYMDGGIADSIPYKKAMAEGCDKNIVILTREASYRKRTDRATEIAARKFKKYPEFSAALMSRAERYNNANEELLKLEKEGRVFIFRPDSTEGIGRTESDAKVLASLYDKGYNQAKQRLGELKEYLK